MLLSMYDIYARLVDKLNRFEGGLVNFAGAYERFGINKSGAGIQFREWLPGAKSVALMGDFSKGLDHT